MSVIQRVKEIINFKNISQPKLGNASGVHKNTIQKMIANDTDPSLKVVIGLKKMNPNLNLDWLILGEGEMWLSKGEVKEENKSDGLVDVYVLSRLDAQDKKIKALTDKLDEILLRFEK